MPVERRRWVTHGVRWVNGKPEEPSCLAGRRQPSLSGTSRMRREPHVRFRERLGVKFPRPTRRRKTEPLASASTPPRPSSTLLFDAQINAFIDLVAASLGCGFDELAC